MRGLWVICLIFTACSIDEEEVELDTGVAAGKADAAGGPLRITEVLRGDFLELRNDGEAPVDLAGWWLSCGPRRVKLRAVAGRSHVVEPGQLALIGGGPDDVPAVTVSLPLGLATGHLVLRTPSHALADRAELPVVADGVSLERDGNGRFRPSQLGATPGERNDDGAIVARFSGPGAADALAAPLAAEIDAAKKTVDAALYQLDHPLVLDAFVRAANRGVRVRLATDTRYYTDPDYQPGYRRLEAAGAVVVDDRRSARMHDKFVVVDGERVWTGSFNPVTPDGKVVHADNAIALRSPRLAALHAAEMDQLMARTFGPAKDEGDATHVFADGARIELAFAPSDGPRALILRTIAEARVSITFCVFALAMPEVADALIAAQQRGVEVRGVFDDTSAVGNGSTFPTLAAAGIDVRRPTTPLFLHDKFFVVDAGAEHPRVITGSYNFSGKADRANDEALYVVHDWQTAGAYEHTFHTIYDVASSTN